MVLILGLLGCSALKDKATNAANETKEAVNNVKTEIVETKDQVTNAATQVKEAADSVSNAVTEVTEAVDAVDSVGENDNN